LGLNRRPETPAKSRTSYDAFRVGAIRILSLADKDGRQVRLDVGARMMRIGICAIFTL
jgi:hypothetical protein